MSVEDHYRRLYENAVRRIRSDEYELDQHLVSAPDDRFGLTLRYRPGDQILNLIRIFLAELKYQNSDQYYYPDSDIHVTVLTIISCEEGFRLSQIQPEEYLELIKVTISKHKHCNLMFKGITASPSGVMIQGFAGERLNLIRDDLRKSFMKSGLRHTIDKRYPLRTAHSTVCRFRHKMANPKQFIRTLEKYRDFDFGSCSVRSLELVCNDWYHRNERTRLIDRLQLH